uniref:Uncharacterized protein n=1 Tax=Panagrolaimus sp. ES5 TaxID=591445 RepID=A0AC34FI87_9BILA
MVPSSFRFLDVRYPHEIFDLEECFNFIRIKPQINFFFYRLGYLASPEYKIRLQSVTNNLLSTWSPKNKPPQIKFEGQTSESKEAIERLEELYNAQNM